MLQLKTAHVLHVGTACVDLAISEVVPRTEDMSAAADPKFRVGQEA